MKKIFLILTTIYVLLTMYSQTAFADTNCQSIYGGGQSCGNGNIRVQKQVLKPGTSDQYVDSLGYNDAKYQPSSPIFFKITITNATKNTLNNIIVTDTIDSQHSFINFVSAAGNFDSIKKTLTYKISSLKPGEQNTLSIAGKVLDTRQLPAKQAVICAGNTVQVSVDKGSPTSAISAFCISTETQVPAQTNKGGVPLAQTIKATPTPTQKPAPKQTKTFPVYSGSIVNQTPKSGPEMLPLLAIIPAGGLGLWLRKKAK